MSITITVSDLDTMPPEGVRRVAGLFQAIADYHEGWLPKSNPNPVPSPTPTVYDLQDRDEDMRGRIVAGTHVESFQHFPVPEFAPAFGRDTNPEYVAPRVAAKLPNGIEVDAEGLPWDGRIHASSRGLVAAGAWKLRRNVDDDVVQAVKRELQITMGAPVTIAPLAEVLSAPSIMPPPMFDLPALEVIPAKVAEVIPPPFVANVVPLAPPVNISHLTEVIAPPSAGVAPTVSPTNAGLTFAKLMQLITMKFASKELDQAAIQAAVVSAGLPSLPMLASRPDLVNTVADALGLL